MGHFFFYLNDCMHVLLCIQEIYIDHYPQSVTRAALQVIIMISASNNFSSFSICNLVVFDCEFNGGSLVLMHGA